MQNKLSDIVHNLSGINANECKSCMEWTKIKSECDFIDLKIIDGFRSNRLNFKYKECGKRCCKLKTEASGIFSIMHQFYSRVLKKFASLLRNLFALMDTGIVGENLTKVQYRLTKFFIAN